MNFDYIPIWVILIVSILFVMISIETGHRLGQRSRRRSEEEKESPVSAIAGSVLGLVAFVQKITKDGKPIGIQRHFFRRPIFAAGNSDGDFQMFEWTTSGTGPRFAIIVHHTDADSE